jgi:hydroxyacylglutathione hydrolase
VHAGAGADYPHEPFEDGWELALGALRVRAVHTPGHRPEHCVFVLTDTARGAEPWAVLTGDSLFVNDIARPDLAVDPEEGARGVFHSLHERLLTLPAETEVWPGHLGGSMCGGPAMDLKVASTIGYERAHSELLAETDEERFVARAVAGLGPQPPNFRAIVELNRRAEPPPAIDLPPLTPRQVALRRDAGALVVDVRTDLQFDDAHIPDAICNPAVRAGFGTKLAWVADREQPVVFVGRDDAEGLHATRLAAAVGIGLVAGYLAGGMTSWREERRPTRSVLRTDVAGLHERVDDVQVLDVREVSEFEAGHIPGSAHVPYHDIHAMPDGIDPQRPVAVICASGQRSAVAASLLLRHGARDVIHIAGGGVGTWAARGWPIEGPAPAVAV